MEPTCAASAMEWSIQLEKGLRSSKPGVPIKAILQMEPRLQQWSREPESSVTANAMFGLVPGEDALFANAIHLRLADAFRVGDKDTKLSVIRVFLSERKHRDKRSNKEYRGFLSKARVPNHLELLKRVKSVFDSGDSDSRAMALVLFGCWADFGKDNAQIRYLIFASLVSPHSQEVRASLFAAGCLCEISDDFASVTVEMLFNMMNSSEVSLPVKLAAARVFAKLKCSYSVAHKAYKTGLELLNYSDEDFLVAMLFSLSKLASISTRLTFKQVDILLSFLNQERTSHVQETALKCLLFLFRGRLFHYPVNSGLIHGLFCILEEPEFSLLMQCTALRVMHKVLLSIPPSVPHVELHEFIKLLTIAENAIRCPVLMKSFLALHILADLCCRISGGTDIDNRVFCCSSLPSHVISLVKDQIKVLVMPSFEICQNDLMVCHDLQSLLKILLAIVERHPYLGVLVLGSITSVIECLVTMTSTDLEVQGTYLGVRFNAEKNTAFVSKLIRKIFRFLVAFLEILFKADAISAEVLDRVKVLVELVCQCSSIDCYTCTMYRLVLPSQPISGGHKNIETRNYTDLNICPHSSLVNCNFDTLDFVNKILTETDGWNAYKVGAYAACQGEWLVATAVFRTLTEKVKSDSCCSWLKALFHYAYSEGKIQLLILPKQGTTLKEWLENTKFPLTSSDYLDETDAITAGCINDCHYYDNLAASHAALLSSLEILESSVSSSEAFCFQMWYLSLRTRVLENLVNILRALKEVSLKMDLNCNLVGAESNGTLECLKSYEDISVISFQMHRLAEEFVLIGTSFIGMDSESSAVLAVHALSCSLLAFTAGFAVSIIGRHSHGISVVDKNKTNLQALAMQNLLRQLWCVDHETRTSLSLLLNYFDQNKNCFHLHPRSQTWNIGYKDREVLNVCSYAVSGSVCLLDEKTPEVYKNGVLLIFNTLIKWMHIRFRIPKYFFKVRQSIGCELFVQNEDSRNGVDISVFPGFSLTLNICLQLKNVPQNLHLHQTKLFSILYCRTSFQVLSGQTQGQTSGYRAWKDDDIVELNNKLFCHVSDCMSNQGRIGKQCRDDGNDRVVETFLQFEPNQKGQGFSSCLFDVSNFPIGSYRIKWHSCLFDSRGCYWSILPLNMGPVFTIKKFMVG